MKKFCKSLKEHAIETIKFVKKKKSFNYMLVKKTHSCKEKN